MQEPTDNSANGSQNGEGARREELEVRSNHDAEGGQTPSDPPASPLFEREGGLPINLESTSEPVGASEPVDQIPTGIDLSGIKPMHDLIRRESDRKIVVSELSTTVGDSPASRRAPEETYQGRRYSVPSMPLAVYRSLVLPTVPKPFRSARELFLSISELLKKHVPLAGQECSLVTFWSMATWFPDFLQLCPTLVVTGTASAADLLLRTLVAVCRRPLLLADASAATLRALPLGELMPTLLIRAPQTSKQMTALLDGSTQPGYLISSGRDFQQFYCPKCIYVGDDVNDQLKTSNSIRIHVGGNILRSFHSPPTEDVITDFQNRLLMYRFLGRGKVASSKFRVSIFQPEIAAIAEALGATIVDDSELQRGITLVLKAHDEQSRVDRASGLIGIVLRAVLFCCHESDEAQVLVSEIAVTANRISSDEGELIKLSNVKVGHLLKNLGLYSRRLGSAGRGLVLDKATQTRAHRLSQAYDVLNPAPACAFCQRLQTAQSEVVIQNV